MAPRLYAPDLSEGTTTLSLPTDEAEHLARVLRVREGADVRVFNGRGLEREARVTTVARHRVEVQAGRVVPAAAECRVRIALAQAVLKGDKIDDVIRDAVMMGVASVQPLVTARTDVPATAFSRGGRVERWRRIALSSVKQCGRAVLPEVREPVSLAACLEADRSDLRIFLSEPSVGAGSGLESLRDDAAVASALVLIGPEGGWSPEEVGQATRKGAVAVTLGRRTLRADAAPLIALAVLQHLWGDL